MLELSEVGAKIGQGLGKYFGDNSGITVNCSISFRYISLTSLCANQSNIKSVFLLLTQKIK